MGSISIDHNPLLTAYVELNMYTQLGVWVVTCSGACAALCLGSCGCARVFIHGLCLFTPVGLARFYIFFSLK